MGDFLIGAMASKLQGRHALRRAVKNSVWLLFDNFYRMGTAMVAGVLVARYLGPTLFGWLSFATAAVALITSFTEFGINSIVVRELARESSTDPKLMGATLFLRGIGAVLGLVVCVVVGFCGALPIRTEGLLTAVLGVGLLFQVFDIFDLLLQANGLPRVTAWIRVAANTAVTFIKLALIVLHAPVVAFAAASVFELALCALGWWLVGRSRGWRMSGWHLAWARVSSLLAESWPLAVSGIAVYAQGYADQLVIGAMLGGRQLGQYAAAMRLVNVFAYLPMVVQIVSAPEIARAKLTGEGIYMRRLHDVYRVMTWMFLTVAVPLAFLGPPMVRLMYGNAYRGAAAILPWLVFRLLFSNFGVARSMYITNDRLFRFALTTAVAGGVTNVILNVILVPREGVLGAVISSLAGFAVTTFALEVFDRRARRNFKLMVSAILLPWRAYPLQEASGTAAP